MNKDGFNLVDRCEKINKRNYLNSISSNKGFTLVELIVVMTILAIMLSFGGFAIIKWQDWATFNQENEYAQTLFVAAQNQLAEYSANGRLEVMQEELGKAEEGAGEVKFLYGKNNNSGIVLDLTKLTNEEGDKYDNIFEVWKEAHNKESYTDEIVSLRAEAGQYSVYESDPQQLKSDDPEAYWVYELLGAYVYDKSILNNAAISIELTPDDGQVFAVLYSDKNNSFIYSAHENKTEAAGVSDIETREEGYRNERMIGFYGVETLTKATRDKAKMAKVEIQEALLHNENTLNLTFDIEEGEVNSLDYSVVLMSENSEGGYDDQLMIEIPAGSLSSTAKPVICNVTRLNESDPAKRNYTAKFLACYQSNGKEGIYNRPQVVLILDAVDIQAQANRYDDFVKGIDGDYDFANTYSIFRLGLDISEIKCRVAASGLNYIDSEEIVSNKAHMCVETMQVGGSAGIGVKEYTLINVRHLYNIRFLQVLDKDSSDLTKVNYELRNKKDDVVFDRDDDGTNIVNWTKFLNNSTFNTLYDSKAEDGCWTKGIGLDRFSIPNVSDNFSIVAYPSVELLDIDEEFKSSFAGYELVGFTFDAESNIKFMRSNSHISGEKLPVGLFIENKGNIHDIQLTDVGVYGTEKVGAFAGVNYGDMSNLVVENKYKEIVGNKFIGAIAGYNESTGKVDMCQAKAGRIGEKGETEEDFVEYVGGLIGYNKGQVKNTSGNLLNNVAAVYGNDYIGGTVGYNAANAEISGLKYNCGLVDGESYVGGLCGFNAGIIGPTKKDDPFISLTPNVKGKYCVGGVAGYNDAKATIKKYKVNKGTIIGEADTSCFVGGYVGFNASIDLLQDEDKQALDIMSNPAEVRGAYYVGGCIGGNILNTYGYKNTVDNGDDSGDDSSNPGNQGGDGIINSQDVSLIGDNQHHDPDFNDKRYVFTMSFSNNSEYVIDDWYIDYSALLKYNDISIALWDSNFTNDNNGKFYPNNDWARALLNNKNDSKKLSFQISSGDLSVLNSIVEDVENGAVYAVASSYKTASIEPVDGRLADMLALVGPGNILYTNGGTGSDAPDVTVTFTTENVHEWDNGYGSKYVIKVTNNSAQTYKFNDIKIVVEFPKSLQKIQIWNYSYSNEGLKYTFVPNGGNWQDLNPYSTLEFSFNAVFDTENNANVFSTVAGVDVLGEGKLIASLNGGAGAQPVVPDNPGTPDSDEPSTPDSDVINASFANVNYAGKLSGKAFVGGYIGYNMMINSEDEDAVFGYVKDKYIEQVSEGESLAEKYIAVDTLEIADIHSGIEASKVKMWINKDKTVVNNNIGNVSADICVGGIFGYNNNETYLTIFNSNNFSNIVANSYIEYENEQVYENGLARTTDYRGVAKTYYYSYAGGIIGKNNKLTTLDKCANKSSNAVVAHGTYTGGLCEVNDGTIINCVVDTIGDGSQEYIGGLCGLNKNLITECTFAGKTIYGLNVVGGIAAENFGIISDISFSAPKVVAYGKACTDINGDVDIHGVAGLYAGYNGYNKMANSGIKISEDIVGATVESDGRYVGLVVGYNSGKIYNEKTADEKKESTEDNILFAGNKINGYKTVGALCGYNNNTTDFVIQNYTNESTIISKYGEAGGIIGFNDSVNRIYYCVNNALVTATDDGNAGGITSINDGEIADCYNYKAVNAPNGLSGGITAENFENGLIDNCYVGSGDGVNDIVTFISKYSCGGVAASNAGTIKDNTLKNVIVKNYNSTLNSKIGVVAGENLETGVIIMAANPRVVDCTVVADANGAFMGGVAGSNAGLITTVEDAETNSFVKCSLKLGEASYASMGGVAGLNTGIIRNISVDADIQGNLASNYSGYGGIAGVSGYSSSSAYLAAANSSGKKYPSVIENCTFDGRINANGTSGVIANIGGIVGYNGYGSQIIDCYLGVLGSSDNSADVTYITAGDITKQNTLDNTDLFSYSYIGGIAGRNYGKITDIDMEKRNVNDSIKIISFAGSAGGFVGANYEGGIVSGTDRDNKLTTATKMSVDMRRSENNRGPGGIIGLNMSGHDISYVDNYASVVGCYRANMKTGGFIGENMQQETASLVISHCNNYASVTGWGNTGGFIGHAWYRSVRFDNCVNYGEICIVEGSTGEQKYAGGFIGRIVYATQPYYFYKCENHGNIVTHGDGRAAGFAADIENSTVCIGDFYDCVNTGIVYNRDGVADNLGNFIAVGGGEWNYTLCRNYNTSKVANGFGPKGKCINCLDVSLQMDETDIYSPFGNGNSNNNYYVTKADEPIYEFDTDPHGAYFSVQVGNTVYNTNNDRYDAATWSVKRGSSSYGYGTYKNYEELFKAPSINSYIYSSNNDANQVLHFNLETDSNYKGMSSFSVYFRTVDDALSNVNLYDYNYTIKFLNESGEELCSTTGSLANVRGYIDINKYKVTAQVPAEKASLVKQVVLITDCKKVSDAKYNSVHLFGFSWMPVEGDKETVLTGLSKMTGISSAGSISNASKYETIGNPGYDVFNPAQSTSFLDNKYYENNGVGLKITPTLDSKGAYNYVNFKIENTFYGDKGIDKVYFYVSNDWINNKDCDYSYYYTVKTATQTYSVNAKQAIDFTAVDQNGKIEIDINSLVAESKLSDNKITFIQLYMKNANGDAADPDKPGYIFFKGATFVPEGSAREINFANCNKTTDNTPYVMNSSAFNGYSGIYPLYADNKTVAAPFLHTAWDDSMSIGIQMTSNNPLYPKYEMDKNQIIVNKNNKSGAGYVKWYADGNSARESDVYSDADTVPSVRNSRISVYRDIDPKFLEMIVVSKATTTKLATPTNPIVKLDRGSISYTWKKVSKDVKGAAAVPYGYEVEYVVSNASGVVESGRVEQPYTGADPTSWAFPVEIKDEWIEGKCWIQLRVRAINAYRYLDGVDENYDLYDSDWSEERAVSLDIPLLPQPLAHIELTSDNKMVAVLDNPEDYAMPISVVTDEGVKTEAISEFCNIDVTWGNYKFTIDPQGGNVFSENAVRSESNSNVSFEASASPKDIYVGCIQNSSTYNQKGKYEDNKSLETKDRYTNTTIDFLGFTGDGSSSLQYNIQIKNGDDMFVTSDFGAYDKNSGLYIYYDRTDSHLGASAGGGNAVVNSIVLSNIPVDLFDAIQAKDMEARVYLNSAQNEIVQYGHAVADSIILDPEDPEYNYAKLSEIKDKYRLSSTVVHDDETDKDILVSYVEYDVTVWDSTNNRLKPGYSLYLEDGGTYSIYYNATVDLATEYVSSAEVKNGVTKKYHKFEVDYISFNSFEIGTVTSENQSYNGVKRNSSDCDYDLEYLQDGYYIRTSTGAGFYNVNKKRNGDNNYKYFLNIAPAPIIEADSDGNEISVYVDDDGNKTYAVTWDKFYRDNYAWNGTSYDSDKGIKISRAGQEVYESKDADSDTFVLETVSTWEHFKDRIVFYDDYTTKTKYNSSTGYGQWNRLAMNSYYFSYSNAQYEVYLLGKSSTGEYVELSKQSVTAPVDLSDSAALSYFIKDTENKWSDKINTMYDYMGYQVKFVDSDNKWAGYSDITIRIVRLGGDQYGKNVQYPDKVDTNIRTFDINDSSVKTDFVLPRYSEVELKQKQPLQTIATPSVKMVDDGSDTVDSLKYNVSFTLINNTNMLDDLGGYIVEVKDMDETADALGTTYYLVKLPGKTVTNYGVVSGDKVIDVSAKFTTDDNGKGNVILDLYPYRDKTVAISVRALARDNDPENPTEYIHGAYGDAREVVVLAALPVPNITSQFKIEEIKTVDDEGEEIVTDYTFSYVDSDLSDSPDSSYTPLYEDLYKDNDEMVIDIVAKIDVFKDKTDEDPLASIYSSDNPLLVSRFANNNSGVAPIDSVNLISSDVTKNMIFEQYAGYWMRVAIKAHSENIIDSNWTDDIEGADDEGVYCWIQIPKMKCVDTTEFSQITSDSNTVSTTFDDGSEWDVEYEYQIINIKIDSNVDNYELKFDKADSADNASVPSMISLTKKNVSGNINWQVSVGDSSYTLSETDNEITVDVFYNVIKLEYEDASSSTSSGAVKVFATIKLISEDIDSDGNDETYFELSIPDILCFEATNKSNSKLVILGVCNEDNDNHLLSVKQLEINPKLNGDSEKQKDFRKNSGASFYIWKREDFTISGFSLLDDEDDLPEGDDPDEAIIDEETLTDGDLPDDSSEENDNLDNDTSNNDNSNNNTSNGDAPDNSSHDVNVPNSADGNTNEDNDGDANNGNNEDSDGPKSDDEEESSSGEEA